MPCKDLAWHTSFAMKCAEKLTYHASYQYNINKPCALKSNSFATRSSLIQALNGKLLLPTQSLERLLQQQLEIVGWKALEDFPQHLDSGGTFVSQMKWFSVHYNSRPTTTTACLC